MKIMAVNEKTRLGKFWSIDERVHGLPETMSMAIDLMDFLFWILKSRQTNSRSANDRDHGRELAGANFIYFLF